MEMRPRCSGDQIICEHNSLSKKAGHPKKLSSSASVSLTDLLAVHPKKLSRPSREAHRNKAGHPKKLSKRIAHGSARRHRTAARGGCHPRCWCPWPRRSSCRKCIAPSVKSSCPASTPSRWLFSRSSQRPAPPCRATSTSSP